MKIAALLKKLGIEPTDEFIGAVQDFISESLTETNAKIVSKDRFDEVLSVRDSYKSQLQAKEEELRSISSKLEVLSKADVEGLKKENDLYKQKITDIKKSEWEKAKSIIDKNPEKFEKVKKYFNLPEKEEEWNIDVYDQNVREFEKFNLAGLWQEEKPMTSTTPARSNLGENKYFDPYKLPK